MVAVRWCCSILLLCCRGASLRLAQETAPSHVDLIRASVELEIQKFQEFTRLGEPDSARKEPPLALLTSLYVPNNASHPHTVELFGALVVNLQNPLISEVHLLLERPKPAINPCRFLRALIATHAPRNMTNGTLGLMMGKVTCKPVRGQPTYKRFFRYANRRMKNRTVLLSNTDIAFDSTLALVNRAEISTGRMGFVLSVQPPPYCGKYREVFGSDCEVINRCVAGNFEGWMFGGMSWDAYIFHSPLPRPLDWAHIDHVMNLQGAENRAGFELEQVAGIKLWNACRHIHAYHWHCKGGRMHNFRRVDRAKDNKNLGHVVPCWDCPGLREGPWPACRNGTLRGVETFADAQLFFTFPHTVKICLANADAGRRRIPGEGHPVVCSSPDAVNCVIPRGEQVEHAIY